MKHREDLEWRSVAGLDGAERNWDRKQHGTAILLSELNAKVFVVYALHA